MKKHEVQRCPFCGNRYLTLWKSHHARRKYHVECGYCHACAKSAFTKWGAKHNWNRMKNWRVVREKR